MPLYEFRCLKCQELFEMLVMGDKDTVEMKCPHCDATDFERVMSTASFCVGGGSSDAAGPKAQSRTCAGGSCTTYDIPGPAG
jgi:putative FmdB family regulatory protein